MSKNISYVIVCNDLLDTTSVEVWTSKKKAVARAKDLFEIKMIANGGESQFTDVDRDSKHNSYMAVYEDGDKLSVTLHSVFNSI